MFAWAATGFNLHFLSIQGRLERTKHTGLCRSDPAGRHQQLGAPRPWVDPATQREKGRPELQGPFPDLPCPSGILASLPADGPYECGFRQPREIRADT